MDNLWIIYGSGWWFEPLWKILVSWDDYSQYIWKNQKCSKPPTSDDKVHSSIMCHVHGKCKWYIIICDVVLLVLDEIYCISKYIVVLCLFFSYYVNWHKWQLYVDLHCYKILCHKLYNISVFCKYRYITCCFYLSWWS